jgi:hypothetical protein
MITTKISRLRTKLLLSSTAIRSLELLGYPLETIARTLCSVLPERPSLHFSIRLLRLFQVPVEGLLRFLTLNKTYIEPPRAKPFLASLVHSVDLYVPPTTNNIHLLDPFHLTGTSRGLNDTQKPILT